MVGWGFYYVLLQEQAFLMLYIFFNVVPKITWKNDKVTFYRYFVTERETNKQAWTRILRNINRKKSGFSNFNFINYNIIEFNTFNLILIFPSKRTYN